MRKTPPSIAFSATLVALALHGSIASPARAEWTGRVYVDANGNGSLDGEEAGLYGALVSNGRDVVATDETGAYTLPESPGGFVVLTRPAGYEAPRWFANTSTDFALRPRPAADGFFFVQVSDAHLFDRASDFTEFSTPELPGWIPAFAADWLTLWLLDGFYEASFPDGLAEGMRRSLIEQARRSGAADSELRELADLGDVATLRAYRAELEREGSVLGDVAGAGQRAFAEVAALDPAFIVNTGDLILEGNAGSAEAIDRWFEFYRKVTSSLAVPVFDTIGNNEIAGNQNPDFLPSDPGYGKRSFERFLGPTHYSFDYGEFHFIALDTHRPDPQDDLPEWWSFQKMEPDVRSWLEADLEASRGRVFVVLNHEPFHIDPSWPIDELEPADDEGLFARFAIPYVLSGHTHWNSFMRDGGTTHITTGALSGMRWILPPEVHPRGYRLFFARGGELHSAWKRLGEPVIRLAEGGRDGDARVVVAAADAHGPFAQVAISQGGTPLAVERLGDYFLSVPTGPESGLLTVDAVGIDGEHTRVLLALP